MRHLHLPVALALLSAACSSTDPLEAALPALPATGGPAVATAGRLTEANFDAERVPGPASQGLVGDYFMRNDRIRVVLQQPGRAIGPCPFGGNVIDADRVTDPVGDQLGEVAPFLQLGRTINWDTAEIVRDGSLGGPAVIRFRGHDAKDDFINLKGLGSFAAIIDDAVAADVDLKLRAAVTYILMPGESRVRMLYTFYNPADGKKKTLWGTITDTGAGPEIFHEGTGFGEGSLSSLLGSSPPKVRYLGLLGKGIAYGTVPIFSDTSIAGQALAVAGVDVELYQVNELIDALGTDGQSLKLDARGTAQREVDLVVGTDIGDVTAQALAARGDATQSISGTVTGGAGARVAVTDSSNLLITTFTADAAGHFQGALPAGSYQLQAEGDGFRRSQLVTAAAPGTADGMALPAGAALQYSVKDRAGGFIPAKITVIGVLPSTPDKKFRDVTKDPLPVGVAGWVHSRGGDSTVGTRWDHPIMLAPGRYRVVVSRGPEWSLFEQVIDLPAAGARVDAVLDQVAPTPGYIAADFHQHSHISPDAVASPEDRLVSYLADGGEFISSSEHDVLFDYQPIIDSLGAGQLITSAVGVETTPWDYGHYIGFPLPVDPTMPNGGAFDWAGGELGLSLTPPQIFDGLRAQGAEVIQVNHPRSSPGDLLDFQQSFDRAGLRFDFAMHTFYGDAQLQTVPSLVLGVDPDQPMFAPTFDTHEIYNSFHLAPTVEGERADQRVDINLRDWMNFLSFGFTPVPTGVSDSHEWISSPGSLPRTLVRVPDDSTAAIRAGLTDDVVATLRGKNGAPRDVIVTNAPFVEFTVDGAGIGRTVAHAGTDPLTIHVKVTSAGWAPIDTIEVFANNSFTIPVPKGMDPEPFIPALCFTTRAVPTTRCKMAIGGARPLTVTTVSPINGSSATRVEAVADASDVTIDALLARQRAGGRGRDVWLVARTFGDVGIYPVVADEIDPAISITSELLESRNVAGRGVPALAFTNAIFVDADGGGWRGPFQP